MASEVRSGHLSPGIALLGVLVLLVSSVAVTSSLQAPALASSSPLNNGLLAFVDNSTVRTMDSDGSAQRWLWTGVRPAWSPDGTKLAFERDGDIYVAQSDGSNLTQLTENPAQDSAPAWSPGGTKIAFDSWRDGSREIFVMDADGTGVTQITNACCLNGRPAWSPDGTKIAFDSDRSGWYDIYTIDAGGSEPTTPAIRLTDHAEPDVAPEWSPDGTKIVFTSGRRGGNGDIWVMNADGTGASALTAYPEGENDPVWSPDGSMIAYTRGVSVHVMDADGTNDRDLGIGWHQHWQPLPPCTVTGTAGPESIQGTAEADVICGMDGDDTIDGAAGNDVILGGEGVDTLGFTDAPEGVTANLLEGISTGRGTDLLYLMENVDGTPADDALTGKETANELAGFAGGDTINGFGGQDDLQGGEGSDTVSYASPHNFGVTVDLEAGTAIGDGADRVMGFENAVGSRGSDTLFGTDSVNQLDGAAAWDRLEGRGGDDSILGGPDGAVASYTQAPGPVRVDLGTQQVTGDGNDSFSNINGALGSNFDDVLIGDAGSNNLSGNDGDDTMAGAGDIDSLGGGPGIDTVLYTSEPERVMVDLVQGMVWNHDSRFGDERVAGVEIVVGSAFDDWIQGDASANRLVGGAGDDQLIGLPGDDFLVGGSGRDALQGGDGPDSMRAGPGGDFVDGGSGDDDIAGGPGADEADFIREPNGVVVDLSKGFASGAGSDMLTSIENVEGTSFADILIGDGSANQLEGAPGSDLISGRAGRDRLVGDRGADRLHGNGDGDFINARDRVRANDLSDGGAGKDDCRGDPGDTTRRCP